MKAPIIKAWNILNKLDFLFAFFTNHGHCLVVKMILEKENIFIVESYENINHLRKLYNSLLKYLLLEIS